MRKRQTTQLSSPWAFRNFGLLGDSIVCFRGPCRVELSEMVDLEAFRKKAPIFLAPTYCTSLQNTACKVSGGFYCRNFFFYKEWRNLHR